ncbi:hypothetical protein CHLRE_01g043150v5 [Chlamydomonas reinhardtii]|uniref:Uncharacterized protein n=1 Tax=Chlamydomonas reinhardtii TaxID=3055 RepID=A8HMR5_CHLRE|nr:uncharacterized protein CHLRE_01g043150v5 [Chlamydomonas reinhardtii]PNW88756.1 hypothetical protein CHLRE_01g043150v5 [Chlamydomonas reinhardtii]|eukprot:XP_001689705.1 predicted protein [Chlamydomonas reinhardtii]
MNGTQPRLSGATAPPPGLVQVPQPFTSMWPQYYATGGSAPAVIGATDTRAEQAERDARKLKRKQANRESAKRSKLKRQQAERALHEEARRVESERDGLTSQYTAAQQRLMAAQSAQMELRRKIQKYAAADPGPSGGGTGSVTGGASAAPGSITEGGEAAGVDTGPTES